MKIQRADRCKNLSVLFCCPEIEYETKIYQLELPDLQTEIKYSSGYGKSDIQMPLLWFVSSLPFPDGKHRADQQTGTHDCIRHETLLTRW